MFRIFILLLVLIFFFLLGSIGVACLQAIISDSMDSLFFM